jgi:hypothetical protein
LARKSAIPAAMRPPPARRSRRREITRRYETAEITALAGATPACDYLCLLGWRG